MNKPADMYTVFVRLTHDYFWIMYETSNILVVYSWSRPPPSLWLLSRAELPSHSQSRCSNRAMKKLPSSWSPLLTTRSCWSREGAHHCRRHKFWGKKLFNLMQSLAFFELGSLFDNYKTSSWLFEARFGISNTFFWNLEIWLFVLSPWQIPDT